MSGADSGRSQTKVEGSGFLDMSPKVGKALPADSSSSNPGDSLRLRGRPRWLARVIAKARPVLPSRGGSIPSKAVVSDPRSLRPNLQ